MSEYKVIRLKKELITEMDELIKNHPFYNSRSDFIRLAIVNQELINEELRKMREKKNTKKYKKIEGETG